MSLIKFQMKLSPPLNAMPELIEANVNVIVESLPVEVYVRIGKQIKTFKSRIIYKPKIQTVKMPMSTTEGVVRKGEAPIWASTWWAGTMSAQACNGEPLEDPWTAILLFPFRVK